MTHTGRRQRGGEPPVVSGEPRRQPLAFFAKRAVREVDRCTFMLLSRDQRKLWGQLVNKNNATALPALILAGLRS